MPTECLTHTVRELMQPVEVLRAEDSLDRGAALLRRATAACVPVVDEGRFVGAVTDARMARCLSEGCSPNEPVMRVVDHDVLTIPPYVSGAEALRVLSDTGADVLVVVDDSGHVMGAVEASDLFPRRPFQPSPGSVGGMATPFGVHLTTGTVSAGVPFWAIMSTGALLGTLLVVSVLATDAAVQALMHYRWAVRYVGWVDGLLPLVLVLTGMRLLPISGIHAAEHKVVHAIERGEDLVPEVVRRMPRVHPRCGTNLAVGATLFLGLATSHWVQDDTLRLLGALLATALVWRPLGTSVQRYATTKEPNARQLAMGIRAGRDLLHRYSRARRFSPTLGQRIWHSGMVHVAGGAILTYLVAWGFLALVGKASLL